MPFIVLLVGAIIGAAAIEGTQGNLATALESDLPPYLKWAAALGGIGAIGFVPGLRDVSRWLMALVLTVLVVNNWTQIQQSFTSLAGTAPQPVQAPASTAQQFQTATASISGLQAGAGTSTAGGFGAGALAGTGTGTTDNPFGDSYNAENVIGAMGGMPGGGNL